MSDPRSEFVAICARVDRHELIGAECLALTGGRPDPDGVARCRSIDLIARAAYVQTGVRVIARGATFDELVDAVSAADFEGERFRIDLHDPANRLGRSTQEAATTLADVMGFDPDLKHPAHRFMVVAAADDVMFGEVAEATDAMYRVHDTKPWTTSSSLDARFSRALVNLVPSARSILDPCCGAGSIVLEAASLGLDAYGVDWKPAMAGMTRENLAAFGYEAGIELADSRTCKQRADAVVTDLPYGHAIQSDESTVRAILEQCATLSPLAVFVSSNPIESWIESAGYDDIEVCSVEKRRGFTRWIHVARSTLVSTE